MPVLEHLVKSGKIIAQYDEKPFLCVMCGDTFSTSKKLAEHQHYFCTGGW